MCYRFEANVPGMGRRKLSSKHNTDPRSNSPTQVEHEDMAMQADRIWKDLIVDDTES